MEVSDMLTALILGLLYSDSSGSSGMYSFPKGRHIFFCDLNMGMISPIYSNSL